MSLVIECVIIQVVSHNVYYTPQHAAQIAANQDAQQEILNTRAHLQQVNPLTISLLCYHGADRLVSG